MQAPTEYRAPRSHVVGRGALFLGVLLYRIGVNYRGKSPISVLLCIDISLIMVYTRIIRDREEIER